MHSKVKTISNFDQVPISSVPRNGRILATSIPATRKIWFPWQGVTQCYNSGTPLSTTLHRTAMTWWALPHYVIYFLTSSSPRSILDDSALCYEFSHDIYILLTYRYILDDSALLLNMFPSHSFLDLFIWEDSEEYTWRDNLKKEKAVSLWNVVKGV